MFLMDYEFPLLWWTLTRFVGGIVYVLALLVGLLVLRYFFPRASIGRLGLVILVGNVLSMYVSILLPKVFLAPGVINIFVYFSEHINENLFVLILTVVGGTLGLLATILIHYALLRVGRSKLGSEQILKPVVVASIASALIVLVAMGLFVLESGQSSKEKPEATIYRKE